MSGLRTYLQLMRFPAVFTAAADIFLGFTLTHPEFGRSSPATDALQLVLLLAASSGLYLAGMVLNDVFDVEEDRVERPGRPIPSGRITAARGWQVAIALLLLGLTAAALTGRDSVAVATGIVVAVFLYDGVLKQTILGPPAMGACRTLNIMLGASAVEGGVSNPVVLIIALGMGGYVMGVTWFARCEAGSGATWPMKLGWLIINVAIIGLIGFLFADGTAPVVSPNQIAFLLGVVLLVLNRQMIAAIQNAGPERIQMTVRTMLLTIITLDAGLLLGLTANVPMVLLTMVLHVPARLVGRWVYMT